MQIQFNVKDTSAALVIKKWEGQDAIAPSDFIYREPVLAQRVRLFEAAGVRAKRKLHDVWKSEEGIPEIVLQLVSECREEGYFTSATRHLTTINAEHLSREMTVSAFHTLFSKMSIEHAFIFFLIHLCAGKILHRRRQIELGVGKSAAGQTAYQICER